MKLIKKILSILCLFSFGITQIQAKNSEGDKEVLKELFSGSKSYSNLSSEVRSLVDKFLWNPITLENGNTYRLFLCSKGKGREHELSLKCKVSSNGKNSLQTIPDLIQTDKNFGFLVASQNSNYLQNKESMGLIRAQQEHKSFHKKLIDQLNTHKAEKNYINYLENQRQSFLKHIDAWKNYASLGGSVVEKNSAKIFSNVSVPSQATVNVISGSAKKAIPASNTPFFKSGIKAVKVIPAMIVVGAAGLAYNYFKNNDEVATENSTNSHENKISNDNNKENVVSESTNTNTSTNNFSYVTQLSNFCTSNPGRTLGATAIVGALVYGAYKLYKSDFFSEAKKVNDAYKLNYKEIFGEEEEQSLFIKK